MSLLMPIPMAFFFEKERNWSVFQFHGRRRINAFLRDAVRECLSFAMLEGSGINPGTTWNLRDESVPLLAILDAGRTLALFISCSWHYTARRLIVRVKGARKKPSSHFACL